MGVYQRRYHSDTKEYITLSHKKNGSNATEYVTVHFSYSSFPVGQKTKNDSGATRFSHSACSQKYEKWNTNRISFFFMPAEWEKRSKVLFFVFLIPGRNEKKELTVHTRTLRGLLNYCCSDSAVPRPQVSLCAVPVSYTHLTLPTILRV